MAIPFTQYLLPDGRTTEVTINRPEAVEKQARVVSEHGWRFECELLTTGDVSLTVFDPTKGEDVAIELVPNGPLVPPAVDRLVGQAVKLVHDAQSSS